MTNCCYVHNGSDLYEAPDVEDEQDSPSDRTTWEKRSPEGMKLFDSILAILQKADLLDGNARRNIVSLKPG
jgi:hypothetical protein